MDKEQFELLRKDLEAIKKLLALNVKIAGAKGEEVGKAMGVSGGRVSQLISQKKYKKRTKGV